MIVTHLDHPRRHRAIGVFDRPPAPIAVGWIDLTRGAPDLDVARFTGGLVVVFDDREAIGEIAFRRGDVPEDPAGVVAGSTLAVAARAHLRPVIEARALARALAPVVGTGPDGSGRRPSLTVAVPTRDRPQHIGACLDALGRLEVRADEILVVDNDPRHPCRDVALAAGARYIVEPRRGVNHARVRALAECRTGLIA